MNLRPPPPLDAPLAPLWQHAPFAIAIYDTTPEHCVLWHNDAFLELADAGSGPRNSLVGLPLRAGFDPETARAVAAIFDRVQETTEPYLSNQFPVPQAPGTPARYFKGSLTPVVQDGAVVALASAIVELTEFVRARQAAEEARRRATLLAEASHAFAEASLDFHVILHTVAREIANAFDDLCVVRLTTDDTLRLQPIGVAHPNPSVRAAFREQLTRRPSGPVEELQEQALASGLPQLQPELDLPWGDLTIYGALVVPLRAQGRTLGTLAVHAINRRRRYSHDDLALLHDLAARAALAVENARMLQRLMESEQRLRRTVRQLIDEAGAEPSPLSLREEQVLRLLAKGLTNAEVAQRLKISRATVKRHVEHILAKLGAAGRAEAVAIAAARGLLPPQS